MLVLAGETLLGAVAMFLSGGAMLLLGGETLLRVGAMVVSGGVFAMRGGQSEPCSLIFADGDQRLSVV